MRYGEKNPAAFIKHLCIRFEDHSFSLRTSFTILLGYITPLNATKP